MFTSNKELQISSTDYDEIKQDIKNFISQKTEFKDYDFAGSTLNSFIDILAYNTYMNSFYVNMAVNESFIDTAQIRANVVSNAKKMGYTPKSANAAEAILQVSFSPSDSPAQLKIPKYHKFTVLKDGKKYTFQTLQEYFVVPENGVYSKTINVYEGTIIPQKYVYSSNTTFEILNENVDLNTLTVGVKSNEITTDIKYYTKVNKLTDINPSSEVYFIQENGKGKYEIYFGNDVLGKSLSSGNIILMEYLTCSGSSANSLNSFTSINQAEDALNSSNKYSVSSITVLQKSMQGVEKEDINSIRFNSQNSYFLQNRLVTIQDFKSYIIGNYSYVESINCWGGEENEPKLYGKVILSIKPNEGYSITEEMKKDLINDLKSKTVLSIDPIFVDPGFTFIKPSMTVLYNSSNTIQSADSIYNSVAAAVVEYEATNLSKFENTFKFSNFVAFIDDIDNSIEGNYVDLQLEKRFVPIYDSTMSYSVNFNTEIYRPYEGFKGSISSNGFKTNTTSETLYIKDDGEGVIQMIYYGADSTEIVFRSNAGTVEYDTGKITLNSFYFTDLESDDDSEFKVFIIPKEKNYAPTKNQILLFSSPKIQIKNLKTNEIVKSGIANVDGNISPIYSSAIVR